MNIQDYLKKYDLTKDDPNGLSNLGMEVAGYLYTHNTETAEKELDEKSELVNLLKEPEPIEGVVTKKLSVAEAENRAVVNTLNAYGVSKKQGEAWVEILNMIKTRIKVLGWEMEVKE